MRYKEYVFWPKGDLRTERIQVLVEGSYFTLKFKGTPIITMRRDLMDIDTIISDIPTVTRYHWITAFSCRDGICCYRFTPEKMFPELMQTDAKPIVLSYNEKDIWIDFGWRGECTRVIRFDKETMEPIRRGPKWAMICIEKINSKS